MIVLVVVLAIVSIIGFLSFACIISRPVGNKTVPPAQMPIDHSSAVMDKVIRVEARDPETGELLWVLIKPDDEEEDE